MQTESYADQYKQEGVDEKRENAVFLEYAQESFKQSLMEENWELSRDIIQDVKNGGFEEYKDMMLELNNAVKVESDRITEHND